LLALGVPLSAQATTNVSSQRPLPPRGPIYSLYLAGDSGDNAILIGGGENADEPGYTVSDQSGVVAGAGCESVTVDTARCVVEGDSLGARLLGGSNSLRIATLFAKSRIAGGSGVDRIIGGMSDDQMSGFGGRDHLVGRGGDDSLTGGPGADALSGGLGDDRLFAVKDGRDRRIDCGPGSDVALIDHADPYPIHCERVRYRYTYP
jgi:Ca2+-binding RTX toxin-like protein